MAILAHRGCEVGDVHFAIHPAADYPDDPASGRCPPCCGGRTATWHASAMTATGRVSAAVSSPGNELHPGAHYNPIPECQLVRFRCSVVQERHNRLRKRLWIGEMGDVRLSL